MFTNFHHAFHWLRNHRLFIYGGAMRQFGETSFPHDALSIEVVKCDVNDEASEVTGLPAVKTRVWLEVCGRTDPGNGWEQEVSHYREVGIPTHLYTLDCGGDTFEEAICNLATLVYQQHGNDPIDPEEVV